MLKDGSREHWVDVASSVGFVAQVMNIHSTERGDANARLIAAAPDLLDALRLCITEAGSMSMLDPAQHARKRLDHISATARAAIVRAEGGAA